MCISAGGVKILEKWPFLALFGISFSNLKKLRLHMTINVLKYVEEYLDVPLSVFR